MTDPEIKALVENWRQAAGAMPASSDEYAKGLRDAGDALLAALSALQKERDETLEALAPFAKLIERKTSYDQPHFGPWNSDDERHVVGVSTGDMRRAAAVHTRLSRPPAEQDNEGEKNDG